MDKTTPSRPRKVSSEKLPPVNNPLKSEDREEFSENKYAQRPKIGRPTIGVPPDYVESVGLGTLTVVTAYGKPNSN